MVLSYASIMILIPGFVNPVFQPRSRDGSAGAAASGIGRSRMRGLGLRIANRVKDDTWRERV